MSAASWPVCLTYLERECNYGRQAPYSVADRLYAMVLWTFAECIAATSIMEIGVGPESVSGCTFIHNMAQRGGGCLYSVDVDPALPQPKYRALAQALGVEWSIAHGDSLAPEVGFPASLLVDLLYIDGNHDAAHAGGDLAKFLPHLRPGGYLLIDDFPPQRGVGEGRTAIEQIVPHAIHLAHHAPHGNGRLVWQRPV